MLFSFLAAVHNRASQQISRNTIICTKQQRFYGSSRTKRNRDLTLKIIMDVFDEQLPDHLVMN